MRWPTSHAESGRRVRGGSTHPTGGTQRYRWSVTFTGIPNPTDFAALPSEATEKWGTFPGHMGGANFAQLVGLQLEEVRADYARMRVPWRPEIRQPAGMMHGGALATLVDTVVVPAIACAYEQVPVMLTLNLSLSYRHPRQRCHRPRVGHTTRPVDRVLRSRGGRRVRQPRRARHAHLQGVDTTTNQLKSLPKHGLINSPFGAPTQEMAGEASEERRGYAASVTAGATMGQGRSRSTARATSKSSGSSWWRARTCMPTGSPPTVPAGIDTAGLP